MTPAVAVPAVPPLTEVMTCALILPDTALGEDRTPTGPFIRRPAQYWGAPVPPADTNSFENIAAHPEFVRIAVAYDTLPPAAGAVWGAFPSAAQWHALAPRGPCATSEAARPPRPTANAAASPSTTSS